MTSTLNTKLVGAILVGLALVGGAYTLANFGEQTPIQPAAVAAATAPRVAIAVTDNDNNGIEDWRDAFITTPAIVLDETVDDYIPPETLTGQVSINFFEDYIRSRNSGPFGKTPEAVVADTVSVLADAAVDTLYGTKDVEIINDWTEVDIKNYANAMAGVIIRNDPPGSANEIDILRDVVNRQQIERIPELEALSLAYASLRDESLTIPVPAILLKQHLDLINTYHALANDIKAMTLSLDDPALALVRIRRYEDDAVGLLLALQNMYLSIEPYSNLFDINDPALFFSNFNPSNLGQ